MLENQLLTIFQVKKHILNYDLNSIERARTGQFQ